MWIWINFKKYFFLSFCNGYDFLNKIKLVVYQHAGARTHTSLKKIYDALIIKYNTLNKFVTKSLLNTNFLDYD